VVVPHGAPAPTTVRVARGRGPYSTVVRQGETVWEYRPKGRELSLAARASVADTVDEHGRYMDFYANCEWVDSKATFDRIAISVTDARAGDSVIEWGSVYLPGDGIKITARAKCSGATWPRFVSQPGECDKAPVVTQP
jgi:hypothetical protein